VSICPAAIRSEGEANTGRRGHDHEERVVYIPYQFMKALQDDRLQTAARDARALAVRRAPRGRTSGQLAGRSGSCPPGRPADHPAGTARY
jgi:hypothetical protein